MSTAVLPQLLLEGTFDAFSIDEVLDVVALSRQTMELQLEDDARKGAIVVKAGRVLYAEAPPSQGREAFVSLYQQPGRSFRVWRRDDAADAANTVPLGSLAAMVEDSRRFAVHPLDRSGPLPGPQGAAAATLLSGRFTEHSIDDVLGVISTSRQLMQLAVRREDGTSASVVVKAGYVIGAVDQRGRLSGTAAFAAVVSDPGESFEVVRLRPPPAPPVPLGSLSQLLRDARRRVPTHAPEAEVILEGAFSELPLADVLEVLAISRQTTEIVFHDRSGPRGVVVLKAGRVLSAQVSRSGATGPEAFFALIGQPGERFTVRRRPGARIGAAIGVLVDLVDAARRRAASAGPAPAVARQPAMTIRGVPGAPARPPVPPPPSVARLRPSGPAASRKRSEAAKPTPPPVAAPARPSLTIVDAEDPKALLLDGDFRSFSIDDVLEVVALSRQALVLRTFRGPTQVAELVVKAGTVLRVLHGDSDGVLSGLTSLLHDPGDTFRVIRLPHRPPAPSLGALVELLSRVRASGRTTTPPPESLPEADIPTVHGDLEQTLAADEMASPAGTIVVPGAPPPPTSVPRVAPASPPPAPSVAQAAPTPAARREAGSERAAAPTAPVTVVAASDPALAAAVVELRETIAALTEVLRDVPRPAEPAPTAAHSSGALPRLFAISLVLQGFILLGLLGLLGALLMGWPSA